MKLNETELNQLSSIIERALDVPDVDRSAWIEKEAGGDPRLIRLLRIGIEITTDPIPPISDERRTRAFTEIQQKNEQLDSAGDRVGPYKLLRAIGAGGMGTVWLAERADGTITRQVALKLPRLDLAGKHIAEMKREQRILAALEHPNIARLYDAGVTESGRPYIAMEYVDGVSIDAYVRDRALSIDDRLALFLEVARALAFAHQRLIVHRDLKPQNILVGEDARVHLLDFGIAKLLQDEEGAVTSPAHGALTPAYASPEQLSGGRITVATDVYLLGVVLFELLCGKRPYTIEQIAAASRDPTETGTPVPLVSSRADDPQIAKRLRGDLDTIIAKAMKRDPEQRYWSAEAFAEDVARHLRGEPVRARPDTRWYRLTRFVRRNRMPVFAASLVALAIIAGGATSAWQANRATLAAQRSDRVKSFIASIFTEATPREGVGAAVSANELLSNAASRLEIELANEPAVAAELGVLIGGSFAALGAHDQAAKVLEVAVRRATQEHGARHPLTLHARAEWVQSLTVNQDIEVAEKLLAELVPDLLAGLPANPHDVVGALRSLSFVQAKRYRAEESYATLKQAIEVGERYLGPNDEDTVTAIGLLANTYGRFYEDKLQLEYATESLKRVHRARRPDSLLTRVERWYGEALTSNERPRDALEVLRNVVRDQGLLDGAETVRTMNAELTLAQALVAAGELEEAIPRMRRVLAVEAKVHAKPNDDRIRTTGSFARTLVSVRSSTEALALFEAIDEMSKTVSLGKIPRLRNAIGRARALAMEGGDGDRLAEESIAFARAEKNVQYEVEAIQVRALVARLQERPAEAIAFAKEAEARGAAQRESVRARNAVELGLAELALGHADEAKQHLDRAWASFARLQVKPSIVSADCAIGLARIELLSGRAKEAASLLQPIDASYAAVNPESAYRGEVLHYLAQATGDPKTRTQAKALLAKAKVPQLAKLAK